MANSYTLKIGTGGSIDSIDLQLVRMDGGSGSCLVSSGVPLAEGYLTATPGDNVSTSVKLTIGGTAQDIYAEALYGLWPDGSLRSILLQTTQSVSDGTPVSATLSIESNTATTSKTAIDFDFADAVALPTSASYLCAWCPLGPLITTAAVQAGSAQLLKDVDALFPQVLTMGVNSDGDNPEGSGQDYYDRAAILYMYWMRSSDSDYWDLASQFAEHYDTYVEGFGTSTDSIPPRRCNPDGMLLHYLLTGDSRHRDRLQALANGIQRWYGPDDQTATDQYFEGRIKQRGLLCALYCWLLDCSTTEWLEEASWGACADAFIDIFVSGQGVDGGYDYNVYNSGYYGQKNYMEGERMLASIRYYLLKSADSRIPTLVQDQADYLWSTQWTTSTTSGRGAFNYSTPDEAWIAEGASNPITDAEREEQRGLTPLIASCFGFVYDQTSTASYKTNADTAIDSGSDYLDDQNLLLTTWEQKLFNQQYYGMFHWQAWRGTD